MSSCSDGKVAALVLGAHYSGVALTEIALGAFADGGRWSTGAGTVLLEYAQPHNALHLVLVAAFFTAAFGPLRLRRVLLGLVAAIFVVVVLQAVVAPQFTGESLGHEDGMPLSYTLNNVGILLVASLGAWQAHRSLLLARVRT